MAYKRGLEEKHEQDSSLLIRDTRTTAQRFADFSKKPAPVALMLIIMAAGGLMVPALTDIITIIALLIFSYTASQKAKLPFRLPQRLKIKDPNDLSPGSGKPQLSRGIYFFGNERNNNEELWFSNEDMRTHVLIFGSTGSGKTELLISLAYCALVQGSGFIYVDGKGDNSLYSKVFSLTRYLGRGDDLLLLNFMTGARDIIGPQEKRLSNTMNPFSTGSSSMLSQLIISMMDSSASSSDGDMWKGRAIAFVEALMKILVAMRDSGYILLDANTIRGYFTLDRLEAMVEDKVFVRDGQDAISIENQPDVVVEPIKNYLYTLPGYHPSRRGKQVSQVFEQHGFISMQLTRVFTSLADTYGHIMRTKLAEIDLRDIVLNRRILCALLPALEKAPDELANLGKVIIASLKAMMAAGLGEEVEGTYRDLITRKPTNATTPFLCILDEYGYYAVEGFAVVPAQARSLGFSVIFAGQDLPAFQKASKEEAASIGANTNIKICMKLEDPVETWDFFMKTAGESYVTHVGGFQSNAGSMANTYMDTRSAQLEKRARVDLLDLKEQGLGEMHMFFKSKIVRARTFYANPRPVKAMRLNQLLKVDLPTDRELYDMTLGLNQFYKRIVERKEMAFGAVSDLDTSLDVLLQAMEKYQEEPPVERGVAALMAYQEAQVEYVASEEGGALPSGDASHMFSVFSTVDLPDVVEGLLTEEEKKVFGAALLTRGVVTPSIGYLARLMGSSESQAQTIADGLVKDIDMATVYPPTISDQPSAGYLAGVVETLAANIVRKKKEAAEQQDTDGETK